MQRTINHQNLGAGPVRTTSCSRLLGHVFRPLLFTLLSLLLAGQAWAGKADETDGKSVFLVATDQLRGTGFERTVVLMVHFGGRGGTTGLAINRPSKMLLKEAFPKIARLRDSDDALYLGGPVGSQSVFVLLRTEQPKKGMMPLIEDIYFVPGHRILAESIKGDSRVFAGYTGWAQGQLQAEIERGDWRVIHRDPDIIFDRDTVGLWQQLSKRWSGNWI
ncbi:hypothetical protein MNBD_GAMMA20-1978 [hydrothermal vent metagenome]|uniref:Uncharacterized protein n=1 Tax=hydrothermal vent metagenome TaxID=652676 RepID=A0A3B0ZHD4_9ZZZZ